MTKMIIAGGGLAGSLSALAIASKRPDIELLLVEQQPVFGGNHTWSFFDTDIAAGDRWVLDGIETTRWPAHEIRFPKRQRTIAIGYNSIRSEHLDAAVRTALRPEQIRLGSPIIAVEPRAVTVGGERVEADVVIDARGPGPMPGLELGWQKFLGQYLRFPSPHGRELPVIMDATVAQHDGYRFIYMLPVSPTEMLVEDTYYSAGPELDRDALRGRIAKAAAAIGAGTPEVLSEEDGVLPIVISGDIETFWAGADLPRIGVAGGFFHPTTSYSLLDAVANAALVARLPDLSSSALTATLHDRARDLWRERGFFRLLNRMLFRAAEPDQSYRVLEHFYRLPAPIIARFYAARLTALDKVRILSGKPPVPVGRAIAALMKRAA